MSTLQLKRGTKMPTSLKEGEIGIDLENSKLYTSYSGNIIPLGTTAEDLVNSLPLRFESLHKGNAYRGMMGLGKNGKLYTWGTAGGPFMLGTGTENNVDGFHEVQLPYERCGKVKFYQIEHCTSYVLFENGDLYAWGQNAVGQVGDGTTTHCMHPKLILSNVEEFILGDHGSYNQSQLTPVAILKDKTIKTWGSNYANRSCSTTTTNPIKSPVNLALPSGYSFSDVKKVWKPASGDVQHLFVQMNNNKLFAGGYNSYGSLGINNKTGDIKTLTEVHVVSGKPMLDITGGYGYRWGNGSGQYTAQSVTFFLTESGELYATGDNTWGQTGTGDATGTDLVVPKKVNLPEAIGHIWAFGSGPTSVFAGAKDKSKFWRWGHNAQGQLGIGTTATANSPHLHGMAFRDIYSSTSAWWHSYTITVVVQRNDYVCYGMGVNGSHQLCLGKGGNILPITELTNVNYLKFKQVKPNVAGSGDSQSQVFWLTEDGELYVSGYSGNTLAPLLRGVNNDTLVNPTSTLRKLN